MWVWDELGLRTGERKSVFQGPAILRSLLEWYPLHTLHTNGRAIRNAKWLNHSSLLAL
jgi:hypothetical protein